jgi:MoaA/NifB/PqqE/SkfB family radical SAM enzyme
MDFSFLRVARSGGGLPRKILPLGLVMLKNCFKYNWHARTRTTPLLPRAVCLFVTSRCNLRCRMCGIWQHSNKAHGEEMSLGEIEKHLSDPLFKKLEFVNINGGEPNLRKDLTQVGELIVQRIPGLKALSINTNGIPPERAVANAGAIASFCLSRKVRFSISLSLHDVGLAYDRIAGVEGAYDKVMDTMSGLREIKDRYGLYLSANCVITPLNAGHLDRILEWSQRMNIPVNFVLGEIRERFQNYGMEHDTLIGDENKEEIISFLRRLAVRKEIFFQHTLRYESLANMLEYGSERNLACYYALGGAVIGSDGALSYCPHSKEIGYAGDRSLLEIYFDPSNLRYLRESLRRDRCPKCPSYNFNRMEVEKDLWKVTKYLVLTK